MDLKEQLEIQALYARQAVEQTGNPAPGLDLPEALRDDGPTISEWIAAGYRAAGYPPEGYAPRSTAEEIAEAIAAEASGQGGGGADLTREGIAKMAKAAVLELLEAHGVEGATGTLAELRAQLIAVMFVEG